MNNRKLLIAAVFHFVHPVGETRNVSLKNRMLSQANIYCAQEQLSTGKKTHGITA